MKMKAFLCPIVLGFVLVIADLMLKVPGGALTTYSILDGKSTDNYEFDDHYSAIDEIIILEQWQYLWILQVMM